MESVTVVRWVGGVFYKPRTKICLVIRRVGSFFYILESVLSFVGWGVSLTRPVLEFVSRSAREEFVSHAS